MVVNGSSAFLVINCTQLGDNAQLILLKPALCGRNYTIYWKFIWR